MCFFSNYFPNSKIYVLRWADFNCTRKTLLFQITFMTALMVTCTSPEFADSSYEGIVTSIDVLSKGANDYASTTSKSWVISTASRRVT